MPVLSGKLRDLITMVEKLGPNLAEILPLLMKYAPQLATELDLVAKFRAIEEPVTTDAGIQARVTLALEMAKVLTVATDTALDDQVLATVEKLLSNTALQHLLASVLQKLLQAPKGGDHALKLAAGEIHLGDGVFLLPAHRDAYKLDFEAASIPWDKIMALLPMLLEIFKLFTGK